MGILETIAGVLIIAWIAGLVLHIAGGFIHLLLIIALIVLAVRFLRGKTPS